MKNLFERLDFHSIILAVITLIIGVVLAKIIAVSSRKILQNKLNESQSKAFSRLIFYVIFVIFLISGLQTVGFQFGVLLGAAGIVTLAIGFASQLSVSNVISGLFLYFERPFKVGQTIKINNIVGQVESINLLSIYLKTSENLMVRIPNETLIKNSITNYSHFFYRNFTLILSLDYSNDIHKIKQDLQAIAHRLANPQVEQSPAIIVSNISKEGTEFTITMWAAQKEIAATKRELYEAVASYIRKKQIKLTQYYYQVELKEPSPHEV